MRIAKHGSHQDSLRIMRRCPLFVSLPLADLRNVLAKAQERQIMRREAVFRQGDQAEDVYLLTRGRMKLLLSGLGVRGIILAFVAPGEAFGYQALMAGTTHTHAAQAIVESSVLSWDAAVLEGVLRRHPAATRNALRLTARQIQDSWNRLHAFITEPVARRLARELLQFTRASRSGKSKLMSIVQQDLAELLGTTPPTVSRILGRWEAQGLVAAGRERIVILRPEGLIRFAGWGDASGPWGAGPVASRSDTTTE